jgi:energy-coupling factor transport system ATP-binding protein
MVDQVGFVFQDPEAQFVTEQVEDELAFTMENLNFPQSTMRKRVEETLDQLSIAHLRRRGIDTLSGGERQRVAIGSVLTLQPSILILDEPTSQLDPQAAEEVLTTLQKLNEDLGLTIIISEHRLERVAQYADRVCYLPAPGESPVVGPPREILAQSELAPPLVELGQKLGWQPVPLTIKEGRRFAAALQPQLANGKNNGNRHVTTDKPDTPIITVKNVSYRYDNHAEALQDINLTVQAGERVVLMGRNGSGKSTLLKHLVGLLHPQRGQIQVLGQNTQQTPLIEMTRRVGFVPQNPGRLLFHDTVAEELTFTRQAHHLPPLESNALLEELGLAHRAKAYPRDLSSGERQRAALAAILAAEPEILLLDEPTRGLDYRHKAQLTQILNQLAQQAITIIMATHDVELVAHCADRVIMMAEGQAVVDGPVREVMTESMVFASQINKLFRDNRFLTTADVLQALQPGCEA